MHCYYIGIMNYTQSQKLKQFKCSSTERIYTSGISHSGRLLSKKKEQNTDPCDNMDGSQKHRQ